MSTRPEHAGRAGAAGAPNGAHRVVILANEVIGDDALVQEVLRHTEGRRSEALIVAPARVGSPVDLAAGDVDDEIAEARRRVEASAAALRERGVDAGARVGDADPNLALEDALRLFPADEVVMVVHPRERRTWLEQDVVEQAQRTVSEPITVIEVDAEDGAPSVTDVREVRPAAAEESARERRESREASYLPPMPRGDRAALMVGPLGTLALFGLALGCGGEFRTGFSLSDFGCFASWVGGVYALLVTAIHVPAVLVLQGERYARGLRAFMSVSVLVLVPLLVLIAAAAVLVF